MIGDVQPNTWRARWIAMHDAERAQVERLTGRSREQKSDGWAQRANAFAAAMRRTPQPDGFVQRVLPYLRATDTVMDIGAGSGRHVAYLAGVVAQVVAVEPSASLREHLARRLAEEQRTNVAVVAEPWPEAAVPPCDIAISAHVLYSVRDIVPFVERMHATSRRTCALLLGLRQPGAYIAPFWEQVYDEPRAPAPGALECLHVLAELGYPAQMQLVPAAPYVFVDDAEARDDLRWRLRLAPTPANEAQLTTLMDTLLIRDATGRLQPRDQPTHHAVLMWATHQHDQ